MLSAELEEVAQQLQPIIDQGREPAIRETLDKLEAAIADVGRSWSGSYLGYHARTYWVDFQKPPSGIKFNDEWGFEADPSKPPTWVEYDSTDVYTAIFQKADFPSLADANAAASAGHRVFEDVQAEVMSLLVISLTAGEDPLLRQILTSVEELKIPHALELLREWMPKGALSTRDRRVTNESIREPEHLIFRARITAMRKTFDACAQLSQVTKRAASHLARRERMNSTAVDPPTGTNVFIGHGRSLLWRELKDFIQDDLKLPWDEFNRESTAGITIGDRLSQMLEDAAFAFLILTAEDEMKDGDFQARLNVVHEAGLFQGKLGFQKAIILLEEGCAEFSNIHGLGQIRFPPGKISAVFEEIRRVLRREGML